MFKIITCINKKGVIGNEGKLLYHIKNDLANFKRMTVGNVIIMGRKTFESLPGGKPLNDRINIVLTHDAEWGTEPADNLFIVNSIEDAIGLCEAYFTDKDLFVIGGETLYNQFLKADVVDEMRLTIVDDESEGDTSFPQFDNKCWDIYYESLPQVEGNISFTFQILKRNGNEQV